MDQTVRDEKIAAARKRLKQFKRNKKQTAAKNSPNNVQNSTNEPPRYDKDINAIASSENYIDEKFASLNCEIEDSLLDSTAATTESILQVSAKLNGLAAEADMIVDINGSYGTEEHLDKESFRDFEPNANYSNSVSGLEVRNQELAANVSTLQKEKKTLIERCNELAREVDNFRAKSTTEKKTEQQCDDDNTLRQQLQVQMQTIGFLVSEKQDLQHELMTLKAEHQSHVHRHENAQEKIQDLSEKVMSLERELKTNTESLILLNSKYTQLKSEYDLCQQAYSESKNYLDSEQMQKSELCLQLQSKESELGELQNSHKDMSEKLAMAEVLLQQMSTNNGSDASSELICLQQDNDSLNLKLIDYHQAFEQLKAERQQLSESYEDAQKQWISHIQATEEKYNSLVARENELQTIIQDFQNKESKNDRKPEEEEVHEYPAVIEIRKKLDEMTKVKDELQQQMLLQQENNQQLSQLLQEKESRIYELQNTIESTNTSAVEQGKLLEEARNDKSTISRVLVQNKQLKVQLQEIQEGFIRMSNDKMQLATDLTSLEHANKDLQLALNKHQTLITNGDTNLSAINEAYKQLERVNGNLKQQLSENEPKTDDINQMMQLKLNATQQSFENLKTEYFNLKEKYDNLSQPKTLSLESVPVTPVVNVVEHDELNSDAPVAFANGDVHENDDIMEETSVNENAMVMALDEKLPITESDLGIMSDSMALLQEKFTSVMKEKAELLNKLELLEHTNTQLQCECDTIGEYIALYHNQRQVLKQRHREKDDYIANIIRDRETMQGKVQQLETLIVTMLNSQRDSTHDHITSTPFPNTVPATHKDADESLFSTSHEFNNSEVENKSSGISEQPDLLPKLETSTNESDQHSQENRTVIPGYSQKIRTHSETLNSSKNEHATAAQILSLLEEMHKPIDHTHSSKPSMPSGFCMRYSGPYTAI